jgi:hypothetical protein
MEIKVITLKQPWAHLAVEGLKKNETRGWDTDYRGDLYIHSSRKIHSDDYELCKEDAHFKEAIPNPNVLIMGAIIGKVKLVDTITTNQFQVIHSISDRELAFGDYRPNRLVWKLEAPEKIDPIYCNGMLGIWKFNFFKVGEEVEFEIVGHGKSEHVNGVIESFANGLYKVKTYFNASYFVHPSHISEMKKEVANG